jgi:hypothetical protein
VTVLNCFLDRIGRGVPYTPRLRKKLVQVVGAVLLGVLLPLPLGAPLGARLGEALGGPRACLRRNPEGLSVSLVTLQE